MDWEISLMRWMTAGDTPVLDALMAAVTVLAPVVAGGAVFAVWRRGGRREAWVLLAALVGAVVISVELQYLLLRPRPELAGLLPAVPTPAFPSGHAAFAAALATFATLLGRRAAAWWAFAGLVMLSRVWLGHHHPTDVLVGAVVGATVAAFLYGTQLAKHEARPRWAWWIWPQFAVVVLASASAYLRLSDFAWLKLPYADKVLHFVLFGMLSFFLVGWLAKMRARWVVAGLVFVSCADEFLQALSPARSFDLGDLVCTLAGVLVFGGAAARLLRRQIHRPGEGQLAQRLDAEVAAVAGELGAAAR